MSKEENTQDLQEEQNNNDTTSSDTIDSTTEENSTETEENTESAENSIETELAEFKDKYLRLYSEFENFRKRTMKEKADLITSASKNLIVDLLPILDDFDRAISHNEKIEDAKSLKEGFTLIQNKFYKILEAKGLSPIDAKEQEFDTELHEAITQIPSPTEDLKGKVIDEVEKGYYLDEKVIRYSKVVVGA